MRIIQMKPVGPSAPQKPGVKAIATFGCLLSLAGWTVAAEALPDQVLVKPKAHFPERAFRAALAGEGALEKGRIHPLNVRVVRVPRSRRAAALEALRRNPNVEFAEPDALLSPQATPNDPYFSLQWHLPRISAPAAWDMAHGSATVTIAIVDSGVESTHPELAALLVPGWNFFSNNSDTRDVTGHGTAVAGSATAAANNSVGVASVSWGCSIMPLRVSDTNGYASLSAIANALTWAADRGVRVANVSFRASGSLTVSNAGHYFQSRGGVVTVSAGNENVFDTAADNPYVLTVSATDSTDARASFSNTGNNVDLSAPGVNILTTSVNGNYGYGSGTSFSAPIVAGVAALVVSVNPALTGAQLQNLLKASTDDLGASGWDTTFGTGRINASKAVLAALQTPAGDATPPTATITAPTAGGTVSGAVNITVSASDNVGVTKVECYLNGSLAGTSLTAPAVFTWDTTLSANGSQTLQAKAYDAAGNNALSTPLTVTVQNSLPSVDTTPPSVQITSPVNEASVGRNVKVYVSSNDNVGVTRVELLLDGKLAGTSSSANPVFSCTTSKLARGPHTLQALAYDAAGNYTRSTAVTIYK